MTFRNFVTKPRVLTLCAIAAFSLGSAGVASAAPEGDQQAQQPDSQGQQTQQQGAEHPGAEHSESSDEDATQQRRAPSSDSGSHSQDQSDGQSGASEQGNDD